MPVDTSVHWQCLANSITTSTTGCLKFEVAPEALALVEKVVPLNYSSGSEYASYLTALLEPVGLDFLVSGRTVRIIKRGATRSKSSHQEFAEKRIARTLTREIDQTFEGELRNLIEQISEWTTYENAVPDPLSIMQGKLDLKAKFVFSGKGRSFRDALAEAVGALGLKVEVRNEAIYLVAEDVREP